MFNKQKPFMNVKSNRNVLPEVSTYEYIVKIFRQVG